MCAGSDDGRAQLGLLLGVCAGCAAAALVASAGEKTQQPEPPKKAGANSQLALPDADKTMLLVRTSLLTVNDPLQTGNYTVLRDKAAPAFRDSSTAISLGKSLEALTEKRIDLSAVAIIAPQLTDLPTISEDGVLHLKGYFPGDPRSASASVSASRPWKAYGACLA